MTTKYVQPGDVIDYTAGSNITAGDVIVIGNILGVAIADIANGETGAVAIEGVFELPKVATAVIGAGEVVEWDVSEGAFEDSAATPAATDITLAAVAVEAAGNGATTVKVKLTPPGVIN